MPSSYLIYQPEDYENYDDYYDKRDDPVGHTSSGLCRTATQVNGRYGIELAGRTALDELNFTLTSAQAVRYNGRIFFTTSKGNRT